MQGALAAGAATSNGGVLYEIVPIFGIKHLSVRIKTATNGGTLDILFTGPDFDPDQAKNGVTFANLKGTIYGTGKPTQLAVSAGTEGLLQAICRGEAYAIIKFTGTVGAGMITFVDVASGDDALYTGSYTVTP